MAENVFQLQNLLNALEGEKSSKTLSELEDDFFPKYRGYMEELEERVKSMSHPTSMRDERVRREHKKAEKIADKLFSLRVKKISLAAIHEFSGAEKVKVENMTDRENDYFVDLKVLLKNLKKEVFIGGYRREVKEEEVKEEEVKEEVEKKVKKEIPKKVEKKPEKVEATSYESEKGSRELLIHIIEDTPTFVDIETTYDLKKEDVVTLKEDIAKVLISNGKARKVVLS